MMATVHFPPTAGRLMATRALFLYECPPRYFAGDFDAFSRFRLGISGQLLGNMSTAGAYLGRA